MDLRLRNQVALLLRILPEIAREKDFALHGGSAINLFYHDMPRLSVDIDLTYLPFGTREDDLAQIRKNLHLISKRLVKTIPFIHVKVPVEVDDDLKLHCSIPGALVKVEVNINKLKKADNKKFNKQLIQLEDVLYKQTPGYQG
jgi:hypothetical protein